MINTTITNIGSRISSVINDITILKLQLSLFLILSDLIIIITTTVIITTTIITTILIMLTIKIKTVIIITIIIMTLVTQLPRRLPPRTLLSRKLPLNESYAGKAPSHSGAFARHMPYLQGEDCVAQQQIRCNHGFG
jgi:hypothetical protein